MSDVHTATSDRPSDARSERHEQERQPATAHISIAISGDAQQALTALLQRLATPEPEEDPRHKLAPERSGKDLQNSSDGARGAAQSLILINGGAASVILAYLSKESPTSASLLSAASVSLIGYALGVVCAALAMWFSSQASAEFGYYWEEIYKKNEAAQTQHFDAGQSLLGGHRLSFWVSVICFAVASFWIASAFWVLVHT
jgi:hypothetical protein